MAVPTDQIAGLILIGGMSERMGSPKTFAELDGIPLWQRAANSLSPFVSEVLFLGNVTGFLPPAGCRLIDDDPSGIGPLGGLVAGLEQSGFRHHLLLAVDYPLVPAAFLQALCYHAGEFDAVCGGRDGFVEPLIGYYHARCVPVIREMLCENEFRTHRLLDRVKNLVIPEPEMLKIDPAKLTYFNVNTPSDLMEGERHLRSGRPK